MSIDRPTRAKVALPLILTLALIASGQAAYDAVLKYRDSRASLGTPEAADQAGYNDRRFQALREALPGRGVIGYLDDGRAGGSFTSEEAFFNYFYAQYSLAPVIVVRSTVPQLVVGNFIEAAADTSGSSSESIPAGFHMLSDFGDGVVLLESEGR